MIGGEILVGVHIHSCGYGFYGFRFYSESLLKSAKVTQTLLPHHLAPRLGSVCPHSGIAPRVAAMGHPCPSAAKPASLPVYPLRNTCVRPAWFNGAPEIKSKARRPDSRPDALSLRVSLWEQSLLAMDVNDDAMSLGKRLHGLTPKCRSCRVKRGCDLLILP